MLGSLVFGVLIHVLVVFGALHRATLATSAAAREYGRVIVIADSEAEAVRRGDAAVALIARNHGLPADASPRIGDRVAPPRRSARRPGAHRGAGRIDPVHRLGGARAHGAGRGDARGTDRSVPERCVTRDERGQASALLVGVLLLGLLFVGFAVDGARLFTARRDLQNVADSAALAGASEIDESVYRASGGAEVRLDPRGARLAVDEIVRASSLPADTTVDVQVAGRSGGGAHRPSGPSAVPRAGGARAPTHRRPRVGGAADGLS